MAPCGIIAGVIKALGILERIDARMVPDAQEAITTGAAVAGLSLHGLGFSERPLARPPPFFANPPGVLLVRAGVSAAHGNRGKRGRSLSKVCSYGWALGCSDIAPPVCRPAGMALRVNRWDPTSGSRTGA